MAEVAETPQSTTPLDLKSLAAEVIARAVKAGATDAEAVVSEGDEFSVSVRMGEVETAVEEMKKAEQLDPSNPQCHLSLGEIYSRQRDFETARKELEKAVQLNPHLAPAYYTLGGVYRHLGLKTEAKTAYATFQREKSRESEGEVDPVGSKRPVKVDVRILSATNRDLSTAVADLLFLVSSADGMAAAAFDSEGSVISIDLQAARKAMASLANHQ